MKRALTILVAALLLAPAGLRAQTNTTVLVSSTAGTPIPVVGPGYAVVPSGHVDINVTYNPTNQAFSLGFRNDDNGFQFAGTNAVAYAVTNQRTTVPAGEQWSFLGEPGGTFWSFPGSLGNATNGAISKKSLFLGWAGYGVSGGIFTGTGGGRIDLKVHSIENLTTPGTGEFYGYEVSGGSPVFRLSSSNTYANSFSLPANGHSHINVAFTTNGMFRVWLVASGTLLATGQTVESEPLPLYFGIEQWEIPAGPSTYLAWRDAEFSIGQNADPLVSGPAADPDVDGFNNLQEYAFGGKPLVPDAPVLQPTMQRPAGLPIMTARARTNATDLTWSIQASPSLQPGVAAWSTNGVVPVGAPRPVAELPGVAEIDWQLGNLTGATGFGHVKVNSP
jgi:hypothetical protein